MPRPGWSKLQSSFPTSGRREDHLDGGFGGEPPRYLMPGEGPFLRDHSLSLSLLTALFSPFSISSLQSLCPECLEVIPWEVCVGIFVNCF